MGRIHVLAERRIGNRVADADLMGRSGRGRSRRAFLNRKRLCGCDILAEWRAGERVAEVDLRLTPSAFGGQAKQCEREEPLHFRLTSQLAASTNAAKIVSDTI